MRECKQCKREVDSIYFLKADGINFFKFCNLCRERGREKNNRRKVARSAQSKEHYRQHKHEVQQRNKEWRFRNKEKLREYEKSNVRRQKNKEWREQKRSEDRFRFVWYAAKRRAKLAGVSFTITKQDIIDIFPLDGKCPMLGMELQFSNKVSRDDSPSLDRVIPELGYVPGNIQLISYRANRIKNDASLVELKKIVAFLERKIQ